MDTQKELEPVITIYDDGSYKINGEKNIMNVFIALKTIAEKEEKNVVIGLSLGVALFMGAINKAICDRLDNFVKEVTKR